VVWLEQLYTGMQACLTRYGTGIIGGDLSRSSVITIAITALGAVKSDRVIRRSTARVGDAIEYKLMLMFYFTRTSSRFSFRDATRTS
jgi:thiamine monophosphate kinase